MPIIPATWEADIGGSWIKARLYKKLSLKTLTQKSSWVWWYITII
jgi:hypothetical protein